MHDLVNYRLLKSSIIHISDDNSSMPSLCQTDFLALVPPALWETGGGVSDDGIQPLLHDLQLELTDSIFSNKTSLPLHRFEEYIEKLVRGSTKSHSLVHCLDLT